MNIREMIESGKTVVGIELGSTRIKTVLVGQDSTPIASGSYEWENQYINGIWTYSLDAIWNGLQKSYADMAGNVEKEFGVGLTKIEAIGFSAMMHGYMPFDKNDNLLVPFRTWRNTITEEASKKLTGEFNYNIPQRWSISHLYQAILNKEDHVKDISFLTTLAGYIHWQLTGEKVLGVGDASGMFPIDNQTKNYDATMVSKFDTLVEPYGFDWKLNDILPKVLVAGETAGTLTAEGAKKLDISGRLEAGALVCPPEGDAGTGMTATNSVAKKTGNVSAGTSVFAMIVLEKQLEKVHEEIDLVTTPTGELVGMVHCNNCTSDINAWANVLSEFGKSMGMEIDKNKLYTTMFEQAMKGDADCGGLVGYNYFSGEPVTGFEDGRPMMIRTAKSSFNFSNFMRMQLYSALGALKYGLDILFKEEKVVVDKMFGHGGFFKTKEVGQKIMAAAMNAPVTVMETAGEGGAWGIAVLALFAAHREKDESLEDYLNNKIFSAQEGVTLDPDQEDVDGFAKFMDNYIKALPVERAAVTHFIYE